MRTMIDGIMTRLSVRKFTGDSVKEEDMDIMLRAGMAAPSSMDRRPWAFVAVTDRAILDALKDGLPYAKMLDKAGAAIIVCGVPEEKESGRGDIWKIDCSAASENILLAAHALGYGAVWTGVCSDEGRCRAVREACRIPESVVPLNVIPIGVPLEKDAKPKDKYDERRIHRNLW